MPAHMDGKNFLALTVSDADGRYKTVSLTEQGKKIIKRLEQNGTHTSFQLLEEMSEEEQKQFSELIAGALEKNQSADFFLMLRRRNR